MAPSKRSAYAAEVSLFPELRSCLVNLPAPLAGALNDGGHKVQECVVDIAWTTPPDKKDHKPKSKSIFAGWSGFASKTKDPSLSSNRIQPGREKHLLEIDPTFARVNGIQDGQRVRNSGSQ